METNFWKNQFVAPAAVIALGLMLSTAIGAYTFYAVRSFDNTLVVTGSAKTSVVADSVRWTSNISRTVTEDGLQSGYARMASDAAAVKNFFGQNGVPAGQVDISPIFTDQIYKYDPNGGGGPREYNLRQTFTVQSPDVEKITALAKNMAAVINQGVILSTQSPEYYYSKLADLRVSLLSDAIKDAKARAEKLAQSSGRRVGVLKSASIGVVQVLAPNSIDVSDYGQYDTSTVDKDVMITVRATFVVD